MHKLGFSKRAHTDIIAIGRYTEEHWSGRQRDLYLKKIFEVFEKLRRTPQSGRKRVDLSGNMRSISVESHVIYYTYTKRDLYIIAVLHERMDPSLHLA